MFSYVSCYSLVDFTSPLSSVYSPLFPPAVMCVCSDLNCVALFLLLLFLFLLMISVTSTGTCAADRQSLPSKNLGQVETPTQKCFTSRQDERSAGGAMMRMRHMKRRRSKSRGGNNKREEKEKEGGEAGVGRRRRGRTNDEGWKTIVLLC